MSYQRQLQRMSMQHAQLVERRAPFFLDVIARITQCVPAAASIWCYGLNALTPEQPRPDWDFLVILPAEFDLAELEALNDLSGELAELRRIGSQGLDVQAIRQDDASPFARLAIEEGFCVWQRPITLDMEKHA